MTTKKASSKLAELRKKNKSGKTPSIEPEITKHETKFEMQRWYDKIRADPSEETITSATQYYADAVLDGSHYVVPVGNLETLLQQHAGITFFYQSILVDCQQARRWLEERLDRLEASKYNYYMHDEEIRETHGVLKTTEAIKMAKADPFVTELANLVRVLAYHEHNLDALLSAFDNNKYMLNNIVVTRKEGLEEVWVDPRSETTNA